MSLAGRVGLVTGAARGIGLGIAQRLAADGMAVALADTSDSVHEAAGRLSASGLKTVGLVGDVSVRTDVDHLVQQTEDLLGPLWLLVNNAGVIPTGAVVDMSEADWDLAMDVDAKGVFLCSQAAIRRMIPRGGGRIVNMSSIAGQIVRTGQAGYCAAKAAVNHFTRCLAIEVACHGITVNAILPGMTRTEMLVDSFVARGLDLDSMLGMIPSGRFAEPSDHSELVAWLASDASRQVTGQLICVDGGQSQYMPLASAASAGQPGGR